MWLKGTTNCTWYVPKRLQIIEELAQKQLFKAIMNKKMRLTLVFQYSQVIDKKSWTRRKMCKQTEEKL